MEEETHAILVAAQRGVVWARSATEESHYPALPQALELERRLEKWALKHPVQVERWDLAWNGRDHVRAEPSRRERKLAEVRAKIAYLSEVLRGLESDPNDPAAFHTGGSAAS